MRDDKKVLPVIALRGMTILPGMMLHFDIKRKTSIAAMEESMLTDQMIFVVMQRDDTLESPQGEEDLHEVGTIASIKQIIRLPEDIIRVMVAGIQRAGLKEIIAEDPYLKAEVVIYKDLSIENISETEKQAMLRGLKDLVMVYEAVIGKMPNAAIQNVDGVENVEKLIEEIINNILATPNQKQLILNEVDVMKRYTALSILLSQEIEILRIKKDFQEKVKEHVDKNQKEYLLREQMKVIREELGETNAETDVEIFEQKLKKINASKEVKEIIKKEINRFKNIGSNSSESSVSRGYIETLLALPWDEMSEDNEDIKHAKKILKEEHYGLEKIKERVLEYLAVRALNGGGDSPIICLVGPPGTGKTSIARSVANAFGKKYIRICLGGVRDEAEIRGHRRTYVGAMPGRIAVGLKNAKVKNPLMLLDEIDKVSSDHKGDPSSALLEVLDSEQNVKFMDHYVEIPIDLSEVLFIATANTTQTIPRPLLDRMEIIEVSSYTESEKFHIAKQHLLPKVIQKNGLEKKQLSISTKALEKIINHYTKEAGVRNLERRLGEISRKAAKEIFQNEKQNVRINETNLHNYLGKEKYRFQEANKVDEVGVVRGLAWTSVGGDTLEIEVLIIPGKGEVQLTGQLGDVMKESAKTGISYIRSISESYGVKKNFFEKNDIHIHIPEGAVPKDGPSAGITMAIAILSAILDKKVRADLAMTGEITLRGRVLPIGGLKEKIIAAKKANIKEVLVPKQNEKDVCELEQEILDGIVITFVENMEQVIEQSFIEEEVKRCI
ncbi:MAG: endopeptidase La [Velocimicrobium sp.]